MFRYEKQAFLQSADNLKDVCRELRECEEGLRMLDLAWKRNPDMPAPRQRLTRSLLALEQRETTLTLLERKMTSVSRIYEAAEQRVESLAEEAVAGPRSESGSAAAGETSADKSGLMAEEKAGDQSEDMRKLGSGYIGWEGHVIPLRPLTPFRPFPWIIRPYRPFLIFPPRRPRAIKRWILVALFRMLFPTDRWLRPLFELHPVEIPRIIRPLKPLGLQEAGFLSPVRQKRRARLDRLFRAEP